MIQDAACVPGVAFPKGFIGEKKMADKKVTALTAVGTWYYSCGSLDGDNGCSDYTSKQKDNCS